MRWFKLSLLGISTSLALASCQTDLSPTQVKRVGNVTISPTVSVTEHYPSEDASDVSVNDPVVVRFSGPLSPSSIDYFTFRVEDEIGNPIQGEISWRGNYEELEFRRKINNQYLALDPGVRYQVFAEYLKDSEGYTVAPWYWEFRTAEFNTTGTGGEFQVVEITPESYVIFPNTSAKVRFSRPIYPNIPNYCNEMWLDAFQISGLSFAGGSIVIPSIGGQVCLRCPPPSNICNILEYVPDGGWPELSPFLKIQVRPNGELISTDGFPLDGEYEVEKAVLFSSW